MEYSICKDEQPRQTVKKIKNILSNLGIKTEEKLQPFDYKKKCAPRAIRIEILNQFIGATGKGSSYINSRASGYAEFIERLQNAFLLNFNNDEFFQAPNESYCNNDDLLNNEIIKVFPNKHTLLLLSNLLKKHNNKIVTVPFYSVKDNKEVFLPISIINFLQGSTGMAAGNTIEEALVQGLSEVCERYAIKNIILNKISLPEIARNEYMKYDKIKGMVEYVESFGFKITIKDASLGENLPAIAAAIELPEENKVFLSFGAHPSFPVAVERVITEFLQGVEDLDRTKLINTVSYISDSVENYSYTVGDILFTIKTYISSKSKLGELFLKNNTKSKFNRSVFLDENKVYNNKQILNSLLKAIKPITKDEIYVRDVSFLGFPSIYIYIPAMTIERQINEKEFEEINKINDLFLSSTGNEAKSEKLFRMINDYVKKYGYSLMNYFNFCPPEILLLYSIFKNDRKMTKLYLNLFKGYKQKFTEKQYLFNSIIEDYLNIEEKIKNEDKIKEKLSEKYKKEDINNVLKIFKLSQASDILSINELNKQINQKINNKNKDGAENPINSIKLALIKTYKNNIPDQTNLSSIFLEYLQC